VSQIARRLLDEVTAGGRGPGSRLPSERRLAEGLGVGRSAIREAIAVLEVLGIVEVRVGSGTYVRGTVSDLLPQAIDWGLLLGERHTRDLVETRQHLEAVTARLAAQRATDADVALLRHRLDRMREAADSVAEFTEADVEFHLEVARIAGNTVLRDILHSVRALLRVWILRAVGADGDTAATLAEHVAVFEAIELRDPDAAATAMWAHMESASARLRRSLSEARP
jgi:DNA-binding FadR family transcriptional regulator